MSLSPGTRLGPYEIVSALGAGGMGEVYRARDTKLGREVAIKVLPAAFAQDADRLARFEREAKTIAALSHPNILAIHEIGTHPSTASTIPGQADSGQAVTCVVTELLEGETLRDRLKAGALPVRKAIDYGVQIARGLAAVHEKGVVHRDLKPENLFLLKDGQVKILDFGLAKVLPTGTGATETTAALTDPGTTVGTVGYMAPEQVRGQAVDPRTDLFALGAVLYEMLTGQRAFQRATAPDTLSAILNEDPPEFTSARADIPPALDRIVRHCLEKPPTERFQSARDVAFAIEALSGAGTASAAMVAVAPGRPWWRWRRAREYVLPAVAVAIVATAAAVWGWTRNGGARADEVLYVPIAFEAPFRERTPWGNTVLLSPDGRGIVYSGQGAKLCLLDLATGQTTLITRYHQGQSFDFSPSGDSLVVRGGSTLGQLTAISLATGQKTMGTEFARNVHPSWGEDGWIYYGDLDFGISRVRSDGSRNEQLARPDTGAPQWMAGAVEALPNGNGVFYGRRPWMVMDLTRSQIWVLDLATGAQHAVIQGVQARYLRAGYLLVAQADGSLLAAPFDAGSLAPTGAFVKVLEGVEVNGTDAGGASFNLSRAGDLLYVAQAPFEEDRVVSMDRTGRAGREEVGWGGWTSGSDYALVISPDGRIEVASVHRGYRSPNLWVRRADQEQPSQLTSTPVLDAFPQFINAGKEVAFSSPRGSRNWDLYIVPVDGSREPAVVLDRSGDIASFDFTRDGRSVVFCERDGRGNTDLLVHRFAPDTLTTVLRATPFNECSPRLSPSESWIAYVSDESGRNEVCVRSVRGQGPPWRISTEGATQASWSHDGRELFFRSADGGMFAVPVSAGATFSFGAPKLLFNAGGLPWTGVTTADDQSFLMVRQNLRAPGRVVLIRNFVKVLREKIGK